MSLPPSLRSAHLDVDAPYTDVFGVLATPSEHHRFDASGMVGRAVTSGRMSTAGDAFTMEMTYTDSGQTEHYRTDNVVTALEEGRLIEWAVAAAGGEPLGWRWRYELEPRTPDRTAVRLTYDWTGTSEENKRRYGVPLFTEADLAASLALLATRSLPRP